MNLVLREFRRNIKGLLGVTLTGCLLISLLAGLSAFLSQPQREIIYNLLGRLPSQIRELYHIQQIENTEHLMAFIYQLIIPLGCVWAIYTSIKMISFEEKEGAISFLYSLPISRQGILCYKVLSSIFQYLFFVLLTGLTAFLWFIPLEGNGFIPLSAAYSVTMLAGGTLMEGAIYLFVGLLYAMKPNAVKRPFLSGLTLYITSYAIGIAAQTVQRLEILRYLSPYTYAVPWKVLQQGIAPIEFALSFAIIFMCIGLALFIYRRKKLVL